MKVKKSKKDPGPTDKIYSLEEVDEMTLVQYQAGKLDGMYKCHEVISREISRLRQSLDDVWSITYHDLITPEKKELADKIVFAQDTLAVLDDMFQDSYFESLDSLKSETEHGGDTSWAS
jgi:hypothetical protein